MINYTRKILIINGPNLNLLGVREPKIYGHLSLKSIEESCIAMAKEYNVVVDFFQSNSESEIIDAIHMAKDSLFSDIIINAGAYSHTSIAIMDACLAVRLNIYEVHISNIHQREEFRRHSYISSVARGVISGFGAQGYLLAMQYICNS